MQMLPLLIGYKYSSPLCKRTLANSKQYGASFVTQETSGMSGCYGKTLRSWERAKQGSQGGQRTPGLVKKSKVQKQTLDGRGLAAETAQKLAEGKPGVW